MNVLFVCLGNICRSPAAEGVFLHLLNERGLSDRFVVDSAGTGGWHTGNPADRRMQAAAARRGIQLLSRARQISLDDLSDFDLVLTMDDANLAAVQGLAREAGNRATATVRPMLSYSQRFSETEVPDPYYGGEAGFEHVLDLLEDACSNLLDELSSRRARSATVAVRNTFSSASGNTAVPMSRPSATSPPFAPIACCWLVSA